jgi:hypothetical protein
VKRVDTGAQITKLIYIGQAAPKEKENKMEKQMLTQDQIQALVKYGEALVAACEDK